MCFFQDQVDCVNPTPTAEPEPTTEENAETTTEEAERTSDDVTETEDLTTEEPELTTEEPELTTEEPELTTEEPEITTEEPEWTTENSGLQCPAEGFESIPDPGEEKSISSWNLNIRKVDKIETVNNKCIFICR